MKKTTHFILKIAKKTADSTLKRDANNTTCLAVFQPKTPIALDRFKRNK